MFSDRYRWLKLAAAVLLLAVLAARYTHYANNLPFGWRVCITEPAEHDGKTLVFPIYTVAGIDGPDRYRISKVIQDIPVQGDTEGLTEGMTVSLRATFRGQDGVAVQTERHHHRLRVHKKVLGILGLLGALIAAPLVFVWRDGGLVERG
ncbi:MAG: hypothetical protein ACI8RZ_007442 [Myxococcota bacterium]